MSFKSMADEMGKMAYTLQGHVKVQDIPVSIENRKGSVRKGTNSDGSEWKTKFKNPYGYITGTRGADGDGVDAYVGPDKDSPNAFVVHQHKDDGKGYDEDKVMLGFKSKAKARKAFLDHYDDKKYLGPISTVPVERLREMAKEKKTLTKISMSPELAKRQKESIERAKKEGGPLKQARLKTAPVMEQVRKQWKSSTPEPRKYDSPPMPVNISFESRGDAAERVLEVIYGMKHMGNVGTSRGIYRDDPQEQMGAMDGDGSDQITDLSINGVKVASQFGFMADEMAKQASVDLYVDKSENMDRGMRAARVFAPGEVIEIAPVLVIPRSQIEEGDVLRNYVFNFDKKHVMVALGYASMFNHSYTPNARYKKDKGARTLTFTAIKPIKEDEEIFVNYNLEPDNKTPLWFDVKEKQTEKTASISVMRRALEEMV